MMRVQERIEIKLRERFQPQYLEVQNESYKHSVPPGSESHFKVVLVANEFEGKPLRARHQMIYDLLKEEMAGMIHALSLQLHTAQQWEASQHKVRATPECEGGSKVNHSSKNT